MTPFELRKQIQQLLLSAGYYKASVDGDFGLLTQKALHALDVDVDETVPIDEWPSETVFRGKASSFADPKDIADFKRCKSKGGSDQQCFKVGDNGVGFWGDDTTDVNKPFVAVHHELLEEKYGSLANARHRSVRVTIDGKTALCLVGDICGVKTRVDLAVGAQKLFELTAPFLKTASWELL